VSARDELLTAATWLERTGAIGEEAATPAVLAVANPLLGKATAGDIAAALRTAADWTDPAPATGQAEVSDEDREGFDRWIEDAKRRLSALRDGTMPEPVHIDHDRRALAQLGAIAITEWEAFEGGDAVAAITPDGSLTWEEVDLSEWLGLFLGGSVAVALAAERRRAAEREQALVAACEAEIGWLDDRADGFDALIDEHYGPAGYEGDVQRCRELAEDNRAAADRLRALLAARTPGGAS
jgi:hypothetical protein